MHHHNFPSNVGKLYEHSALGYKLPEENLPWSPEKSLQAMDELGIDIAVLSLPDGWPIAGKANQRSAEICKQYPGRFGFFASLPDLRNTEGEERLPLIIRPSPLTCARRCPHGAGTCPG